MPIKRYCRHCKKWVIPEDYFDMDSFGDWYHVKICPYCGKEITDRDFVYER